MEAMEPASSGRARLIWRLRGEGEWMAGCAVIWGCSRRTRMMPEWGILTGIPAESSPNPVLPHLPRNSPSYPKWLRSCEDLRLTFGMLLILGIS
jgi:hypothetical protein